MAPIETPYSNDGNTGVPGYSRENHEAFRRSFSWEAVEGEVTASSGAVGLNMAHEALDRHVKEGRGGKIALRRVSVHGESPGEPRDITRSMLLEASSRFANVLSMLGVQAGERVFTLSERIPQLYMTALGALRYRAVFCPLFSAFGPEPVEQRLKFGDASLLVTSRGQYERKVKALMPRLPSLRHVVLTDADDHESPCVLSWEKLMARASPYHTIAPTRGEDPALLHFTSGTTGLPKGAVHVHRALLVHLVTGRYVLDLRPGDIYWCTADPGWVTGTCYGIVSPLANGVTNIIHEGDFDLASWCETLQSQKVNVFYTSPTALRRMMRVPDDFYERFDFSALRAVHTVGEPLNAEAVRWGERIFKVPILDNWWQTETGGIMIANFPGIEVKPGSMGRTVPGVEAAIVRQERSPEGDLVFARSGETGELAVEVGWPSMFRAYLHQEERYRRCFHQGWYLSGDLARRDEDEYFWFVGRGDDIIKTAGHMVGPFEVESVLMEHPAVAEAAVIGKPHELIGEEVKAFVCLKPGTAPSEELRRDVLGFVRKRLGPAIAPRQIDFAADLPKNRAGKIVRRLLKARELGLPEGDVSTLEPGA